MRKLNLGAVSAALLGGVVLASVGAKTLALKEAMAVTLEFNPEIGQALANQEAIDFGLR